jgi:hypothetical protein
MKDGNDLPPEVRRAMDNIGRNLEKALADQLRRIRMPSDKELVAQFEAQYPGSNPSLVSGLHGLTPWRRTVLFVTNPRQWLKLRRARILHATINVVRPAERIEVSFSATEPTKPT